MKKITLLLFVALMSFALPSSLYGADSYVEKEMWNDAYPIYASQFYNGNMYVVQLYRTKNGKEWEMRFIELKVNDNASLSETHRYWVLDNGHTGLNQVPNISEYGASMKEYNGKLYIYIYCHSENYFYSFQTDSQGTTNLTKLKCPVAKNENWASSMVTYRNQLCIIGIGYRGELDVTYTSAANPGSSSAEWKHITATAPGLAGVTYSLNQNGFNDRWVSNEFDAVSWIGARDVTVNGKTEKAMVEELVIGQYVYKEGKFHVYHFDGDIESLDDESHWRNMKMKGYVDSNNNYRSNGFSLKMVEGQVTDIGLSQKQDNINNPIQFILSIAHSYVTGDIHQRQIMLYEYNPETYSFHENNDRETYNFATNLPYGVFGACQVSVPISGSTYENGMEIKTYQRYIAIFRGAAFYREHFDKHHYYAMIKSNQIKVKRFPASTADLLGSAAGRKACTLVGVIEGAPPTVVDNGPMYREICGASGNISSIAFGTSETKSVRSENSTTWGHSNVAGYDGYGTPLSSFSIMGGGGYEVTNTTAEEKTFTTSHTTSVFNTNADMASTGYYIYIIPQLDQYVGQVYTPDGRTQLKGAGDLLTFVQTGANTAFIRYRLDDEKIDEKIRLTNPLDLECWKNRGMRLFDNYGNLGRPIYDEYITATTGNVNTLQSTVTNTSSTTKSSSWELMINTHFYQNHSGGAMTWSSSTSSTVGKDVTISINPVSTDYFGMMLREDPIYYYGLQAYCLNDLAKDATRIYYDDLIRREIMDAADTPFIIAWKVTNTSGDIIMSPPMSGMDNVEDPADDFMIRGTADGLVIECASPQEICIYNASGATVASRRCNAGDNSFDLPSGMYIVRNAVKSVKILKR